MRLLWLWMGVWVAFSCASAPIKVWVELRDKGPVAGENAPVYAPYLQQLRQAGFTPDVTLKWQNRVSGWTDSSKLAGLRNLSMVRAVKSMPRKAPYIRMPSKGRNALLREAATQFGIFQQLFDTTQISALRAAITAAGQTAGQGLRIAIIDADFDLKNDAFTRVKQAGLIVDQHDFVANKSTAVRDTFTESHGAAVLSLLAGQSTNFEGIVPDAKYLLYRSENNASEIYVEEDYVAAAIERAVDSGAQVISISLAYRYDYTDGSPNLPYSSLNGRTRPSSLAALGAARRGVLVSVAMGNDGPTLPSGPTISAPADADSIISVGILDLNLKPCSYTSTGPTYDRRIKPEVSSIGPNSCTTPVADPKLATGYEYVGGTSFAAPVVAGIAAMLRQLHPSLSTQIIRLALMATAGKSSHPDSAAGYGLVRANDAHRLLSTVPIITMGERNGRPGYPPWKLEQHPGFVHPWDAQGRAILLKNSGSVPIFWQDLR